MAWSEEKTQKFADEVGKTALHYRDQSATWQRWVLASCLSINGAAAVAVLGSDGIDERSQRCAVIWFMVGVILSVAYGMGSAAVMNRLEGHLSNASWEIWKSAAGDDAEKLDSNRLSTLRKCGRRVQWIQYGALACFVAGLALAIEGLK
jgi:hypothetical protein